MNRKNYSLFLGVLFLSALSAMNPLKNIGQKACFEETLISKEEALSEIDTLKKYIEEVHPNPYNYVSKPLIYSEFEKIKSLIINDSISIYKHYNNVSKLMGLYNDGHTFAKFPREYYRLQQKFLPFKATINDKDKEILIQASSDSTIQEGSKVIAVNGIHTEQLIDSSVDLMSGETKEFKIKRIEYTLSELFYSQFGFCRSYEVQIESNNKQSVHYVQGIDFKSYKRLKNNPNDISTNNYSAKFLNNGKVCIIDFNSFRDLASFKEFLIKTFTKISNLNTEHLIIDIRDNSGGNSQLGDELFQYIANKPFNQYYKSLAKSGK
ncbi:hypothetical protein GBO31_23255 [Aquimarina litoralis]|nr:hypothetical protein [Aquimarina litoralis]